MNVDFNPERWTFEVTINQMEVKNAFESEDNLQMLLHEITRKCYGDFIANLCFPINEVKE